MFAHYPRSEVSQASDQIHIGVSVNKYHCSEMIWLFLVFRLPTIEKKVSPIEGLLQSLIPTIDITFRIRKWALEKIKSSRS